MAALAYGTETIKPVAKIVGPGNAYVAAAKRLVFGKVGIDMIAGPSEVLILADKNGNPDWIAADLLAQAEHDASAQSILITDDAALADAVEKAVDGATRSLAARAGRRRLLARLRRDHPGGRARRGGPAGRCASRPSISRSRARTPSVWRCKSAMPARSSSAPHTPEAIGDYVGGSNHVLPTARSARFSSGLGVLDFMKRTSILKCGPDQLRALGAGRDRARRGRRARRPCPLGRDPPQSFRRIGHSGARGRGGRAMLIGNDPREHSQRSNRLVAVTLDENSIGRSSPDIEHERAVAIYDLLEENSFAPVDDGGPFALHLSITGDRLVFDIRRADGTPVMAHLLSLTPLRRIVKDYFMICDSYYAAIRTATPDRIEAIDMGRRGAARRGLAHPDGAAQAQGEARFRHRAPPVHADLRAALEGLKPERRATQRPQAVLFACGLNSVRSPMAAALFAADARHLDLCRLGRRAQGRARSRSRSPSWRRSASTSARTGR